MWSIAVFWKTNATPHTTAASTSSRSAWMRRMDDLGDFDLRGRGKAEAMRMAGFIA